MKKIFFLVVLAVMSFSMASFGMENNQKQIVDFVYEKDAEDILQIIQDDWDWLFPHEDLEYRNKILSKEFWEKNRTGKLKIKVLRYNERVVGLVSFYKENSDVGRIRVISVAQDFRKKEYGRKLTIAAVSDLFDSGCTSAYLFTHKDNEKVRTYESLGFEKAEISQDDIAWFKEANISADDYPKYVVTKETFKPYDQTEPVNPSTSK